MGPTGASTNGVTHSRVNQVGSTVTLDPRFRRRDGTETPGLQRDSTAPATLNIANGVPVLGEYLMRTTPFDEIDRLFDRMNRRFADFDHATHGDRIRGVGRFDGLSGFGGVRMDVSDDGETIVVVADLPGFAKADIDLSVTEDALTVSATREQDDEEESDAYVRRERSSRSIRRTVSLPATVDADAASATYRNGVLTVTLPRLETDDDVHRIDVE